MRLALTTPPSSTLGSRHNVISAPFPEINTTCSVEPWGLFSGSPGPWVVQELVPRCEAQSRPGGCSGACVWRTVARGALLGSVWGLFRALSSGPGSRRSVFRRIGVAGWSSPAAAPQRCSHLKKRSCETVSQMRKTREQVKRRAFTRRPGSRNKVEENAERILSLFCNSFHRDKIPPRSNEAP